MLFTPYVCFHILVKFGLLSGRLFGNSCSLGLRYVSWYKYLSVVLVFFPTLGLWSGYFFLIAPFPDHCQFLPLDKVIF